jgi:hypothetical protein
MNEMISDAQSCTEVRTEWLKSHHHPSRPTTLILREKNGCATLNDHWLGYSQRELLYHFPKVIIRGYVREVEVVTSGDGAHVTDGLGTGPDTDRHFLFFPAQADGEVDA